MPSHGYSSLAGIGCTLTNEQLQRLGHEPTIKHFQKLRMQRESFVQRNQHPSTTLAALAYDLATYRALQGPFGRGGKVRAGVAGCSFAFLHSDHPFYWNLFFPYCHPLLCWSTH
jgi:hypothetical protein